MKLLNTFSFVSGLSLTILISGAVLVASPQSGVSNSQLKSTEIPTINWQNTRLPNWNQMTFANMPAIAESGSFQAPAGVVEKLGYDPSRSWDAGQTPDSYMMLGDFQDSFKLQNFSLNDIAQTVNLDLSEVDLDKFGAMKFQTLESLSDAIPDLKNTPISEVKPILDLLAQKLGTSFDSNQTIETLLQQSPHLGKLQFASLNLTSYSLDSIPGLVETPIGAFEKWQGVYINEIPGLADVPFSQFPNPINAVGANVGIVDIAFATDEQQRKRTISGSNKEGFAVPCQKDCAHIELSGSSAVSGKAWVSGKYQLVKGGKGILASVNGGKEPTGRHLFGDAFKVAVWDISEVDGMISQALFFRVCMRKTFVDLGCTPYFIGPVPFMTFKEKESIFLGLITGESSNSVSTPTGLKSSGFRFKQSPNLTNKLSILLPTIKGDCKNIHSSGTNIDAFSSAFSSLEKDYNLVGNYVCDSSGNCGRGLGAMQFMSYRPDVRKIISSKSGGAEFLAKLDAGEQVTGEDMMQYFSPVEQQTLIEADITTLLNSTSQQIDPKTGKLFTGERLIERAAQMNFAGVNIPVDADVIDVNGKISVKGYGKRTSAKYFQSLRLMGCF
ncbi:hypothetical protein [Nostoc sp. TCL26-01]|uniref:hypothetical protein n=1 Tax=Nostoc sp. TCL26-01 TaxID=2576904 RepID=UPI0015B9C002|nr:hypothetical protein [Nostoc sp. TCL26-01]QLE59781.1 hypothetical protein FD725_30555 [Nostoc sp. TCL26-01]